MSADRPVTSMLSSAARPTLAPRRTTQTGRAGELVERSWKAAGHAAKRTGEAAGAVAGEIADEAQAARDHGGAALRPAAEYSRQVGKSAVEAWRHHRKRWIFAAGIGAAAGAIPGAGDVLGADLAPDALPDALEEEAANQAAGLAAAASATGMSTGADRAPDAPKAQDALPGAPFARRTIANQRRDWSNRRIARAKFMGMAASTVATLLASPAGPFAPVIGGAVGKSVGWLLVYDAKRQEGIILDPAANPLTPPDDGAP